MCSVFLSQHANGVNLLLLLFFPQQFMWCFFTDYNKYIFSSQIKMSNTEQGLVKVTLASSKKDLKFTRLQAVKRFLLHI